mgnify:CR=1 FL=1
MIFEIHGYSYYIITEFRFSGDRGYAIFSHPCTVFLFAALLGWEKPYRCWIVGSNPCNHAAQSNHLGCEVTIGMEYISCESVHFFIHQECMRVFMDR